MNGLLHPDSNMLYIHRICNLVNVPKPPLGLSRLPARSQQLVGCRPVKWLSPVSVELSVRHYAGLGGVAVWTRESRLMFVYFDSRQRGQWLISNIASNIATCSLASWLAGCVCLQWYCHHEASWQRYLSLWWMHVCLRRLWILGEPDLI